MTEKPKCHAKFVNVNRQQVRIYVSPHITLHIYISDAREGKRSMCPTTARHRRIYKNKSMSDVLPVEKRSPFVFRGEIKMSHIGREEGKRNWYK